MIRILIVDDHPVVRHGIRQILLDGLKAVTVGEAGDVPDAVTSIRSQGWDFVVLDLTMPGASGLDLLKEIRGMQLRLPVLVLSVHPAAHFARRALTAGASGYLTKDSAPTELVRAIEQIRRGASYVMGDNAEWATRGPDVDAPHDALSDREYQVLRMLGSGLPVSEIAVALNLSVKTVSTYRARILDKLQMRNNNELIRYALENRLVDY